jgi:uncharacterized protein
MSRSSGSPSEERVVMKLARIGVAVVALAALTAFIGVGLPEKAKGLDSQALHGITVNGHGKVTTVPDRAGFWFGVDTKRDSASKASADNNAAMQKLIEALKAAGVSSKDIQTAGISVSPVYSESGSGVVGYTASTRSPSPWA